MNKKSFLYLFPRITITTISILVFIFALFSGAESFGGGVIGIIKNSPNSLPWLLLFLLSRLAHRHSRIGGLILMVIPLVFLIFSSFHQKDILVFSIIFAPIFLSGLFFFISSYFKKS